MKKIFQLSLLVLLTNFGLAQTNRFFYELTYKPQKESEITEKTLMILDVDKTKSIYRDYLVVSQDSIMKNAMEKMRMSGSMDIEKFGVKQAKFTSRIEKVYPITEVNYIDIMLQNQMGYKESIDFKWKILPENEKVGEYQTQKAKCEFGGRTWNAWFSLDIPFQDGPYKFYGLPGMIIKIEDLDKNYSWVLKGNKKMDGEIEVPYIQKMFGGKIIDLKKEKFEESFDNYKKDPFASIKQHITDPRFKDLKMPDGKSIAEAMREQEEKLKAYLNANNNNIEIKK